MRGPHRLCRAAPLPAAVRGPRRYRPVRRLRRWMPGSGLPRLAASLKEQGLDRRTPLVGNLIGPFIFGECGVDYVDLAAETTPDPQPGAGVLRRCRDQSD